MKKSLTALLFAATLWATPALAQNACPSIINGAVLTAGQWNACFQSKQNTLGYVPLNKGGDAMGGKLTTAASAAVGAGINLPQGVAPTTPNNGDVWTTSAGMYVQIAGVTLGPLTSSTSASFAATLPLAVTFPSGVTTYALNYDSNFTLTGSNLALATAGIALNSPTGGAQGAGTFNVSGGYYVNGNVVSPTAAGLTGQTLTGVTGSNPGWSYAPTLGVNATTAGSLTIANGLTTGKSITIQNLSATVANYNFNLPSTAGLAGQVFQSGGGVSAANTWSTATYPAIATTAGTWLSADGTNWVKSTATLPVTATGTGTILRSDGTNWVATTNTFPTTAAIGTVLNASGANVFAATTTPTLGAAGTLGTLTFGNATSGSVTVSPVAGALGTVTASLPANAGIIAELNYAQTWTAIQTFTNSNLLLLGSSTGATEFASANAGPSFFTMTFPAITSTVVTQGDTATVSNTVLVNPATTVNGQTCTLGSGCTVTAVAASIVYGTTTAGTSVGIPYNSTNGGVLSALTPVSGGILYGSSATVPAFSALLTQYGPVYGGGTGGAPVSMAAGTNGQIIVGQTSGAPLWTTAGGDVASISAAGSFTLAATNTNLTRVLNVVSVGSLAVGNIVSGFGTILTTNTIGTAADTITSPSANALAVGRQGATQPAFNVDASTGSQTAGLNVKGAALNGTVALAVIDTSGNTNLTINALGTGTIGIGNVSTGAVTITPATTVTGTLTASNAFSAGSITGPLATNAVKGVMEGDGTTISCTAGTCVALGSAATSVAVGTTTISSGTGGSFFYQNGASPAGTLGQVAVIPAANGGAGTITGALKGNGSGTVSQAGCSDLSNAASGCSTGTGTSGAVMPILNVSGNTFGNTAASFVLNIDGIGSGAAGGSELVFKAGGALYGAISNYSIVNGGGYSSGFLIYSPNSIAIQGVSTTGCSSGLQTAVTTGYLSCIVSAKKFKNPIGKISPRDASAMADELQAVAFTYKDTENYGAAPHDGLYADDVCAIDERLCERDEHGEVHSYDMRGVLAILAAAREWDKKQFQSEIDKLRREVRRHP